MALTSPHNLPSTAPDTPTPYRVATAEIVLWTPAQLTTAQHSAIRERIAPNRGWWQGRFKPWHVATYVISYTVIIGGLFAFVATHGAIR